MHASRCGSLATRQDADAMAACDQLLYGSRGNVAGATNEKNVQRIVHQAQRNDLKDNKGKQRLSPIAGILYLALLQNCFS